MVTSRYQTWWLHHDVHCTDLTMWLGQYSPAPRWTPPPTPPPWPPATPAWRTPPAWPGKTPWWPRPPRWTRPPSGAASCCHSGSPHPGRAKKGHYFLKSTTRYTLIVYFNQYFQVSNGLQMFSWKGNLFWDWKQGWMKTFSGQSCRIGTMHFLKGELEVLPLGVCL